MQNVAWPTMIVQMLKETPKSCPPMLIVVLRAIPVTMPGSASGSTRRKDTVSRPKNRKRWTANAARLPSTKARVVAPAAALRELASASRTSGFRQATANHFIETPWIGQACEFTGLKA